MPHLPICSRYLAAALALLVATPPGLSLAAPNSTGGLQLWLDATDPTTLTLSGTQLTSWLDKSGNAHHATPANPANQPIYSASAIGGLPGVVFSQDPLNTAGNLGIAAGQGRTIFTVMEYSILTNNNEVFGVSTAGMMDVGNFSQSQRLRLRNSPPDTNLYSGAGTLPTNSPSLVAVQASASSTQAQLNGNSLISSSANAQGYAIGTNFQVGGANFDSRSYQGTLSELLVYNRTLTAPELNDVGYSLQQKYGIAGSYTAPAQLPSFSGLQLWLDANDATTLSTSGTQVLQWDDKSGNGRHAASTNPAKRPDLTYDAIGGRPALAFN